MTWKIVTGQVLSDHVENWKWRWVMIQKTVTNNEWWLRKSYLLMSDDLENCKWWVKFMTQKIETADE